MAVLNAANPPQEKFQIRRLGKTGVKIIVVQAHVDKVRNPVQFEQIKKILGVVPQHINFDQDLNVWENLELHARLHHLKKSARLERITELLKFVELEKVRKSFVRELSGGMKRRLLIIRALIHRPKILFLDEPTVALDPQVRRKIWELIKNLKAQGITIVLTTHYIEEAEALCDRVAILNRGKLAALDTTENLCAGRSLEEKFLALTK